MQNMATMATNHVSVAIGEVATSLPRYSHFFSDYIIPGHLKSCFHRN